MAKEKETVKIMRSLIGSRPWMVVKRSPEGDFYADGRKYALHELINYMQNSDREITFDSMATQDAYSRELDRYNREREEKKKKWGEQQKAKSQKDGKLELAINAQNINAEALLEDIRSDHEED